MKILFLSGRLPYPGVPGGHNLVYQRVTRMALRGHQVGVAAFCSPEDRPQADALRRVLSDVELVVPPRRRSLPLKIAQYLLGSVPPWYNAYCSARMERVVGAMVDRSRYEVVVAEFSAMGQYLYHNPFLPAVRRVISCHHSGTVMLKNALVKARLREASLRDWLWVRSLQGFEFNMYRTADRVLTLTPEVRYSLLNYAPDLRISVVPGGVDVNFFQPARQESPEPTIIFTGYYTDRPNADAVRWFLSAVWPALRARHPRLRFLVVGPEPSDDVVALGLRDERLEVTGMVPDIRPYLQRAQVFVCPVRLGNGMRGKILEAAASELAVVSTELGVEGLPAQSGHNCLLADDPERMAHAVSLLLEDPALRRRVAFNGRAMVRDRFSWAQSLTRMEEVLEATLRG